MGSHRADEASVVGQLGIFMVVVLPASDRPSRLGTLQEGRNVLSCRPFRTWFEVNGADCGKRA